MTDTERDGARFSGRRLTTYEPPWECVSHGHQHKCDVLLDTHVQAQFSSLPFSETVDQAAGNEEIENSMSSEGG